MNSATPEPSGLLISPRRKADTSQIVLAIVLTGIFVAGIVAAAVAFLAHSNGANTPTAQAVTPPSPSQTVGDAGDPATSKDRLAWSAWLVATAPVIAETDQILKDVTSNLQAGGPADLEAYNLADAGLRLEAVSLSPDSNVTSGQLHRAGRALGSASRAVAVGDGKAAAREIGRAHESLTAAWKTTEQMKAKYPTWNRS